MPRTYASAFRQFRRRARAALTELRREISARETELRELRDEETRLARLTGRAVSPTPPARRSAGSGRVNWRQVLVKLPKEFGTSDLRKIGALRNKQSSEIYNGISRWADAGLVKRNECGVATGVLPSAPRPGAEAPDER